MCTETRALLFHWPLPSNDSFPFEGKLSDMGWVWVILRKTDVEREPTAEMILTKSYIWRPFTIASDVCNYMYLLHRAVKWELLSIATGRTHHQIQTNQTQTNKYKIHNRGNIWNDERFSFLTTSLRKKLILQTFWLDALVLPHDLASFPWGGLEHLLEMLTRYASFLPSEVSYSGKFSRVSIFVDRRSLPFHRSNFRWCARSCPLHSLQSCLFHGFNIHG